MTQNQQIMKFLLVFFLLAPFSPINGEIPMITDENFDEIVENNTATPLILNFYVENCNEKSNGYINSLSTWEALYQDMDGDLFKFHNINM